MGCVYDPRESERGQCSATGARRDEAARQRNREQAGKLRKGEARRSKVKRSEAARSVEFSCFQSNRKNLATSQMLATEVGSGNFHMANSRGAYYVREKKKGPKIEC